MVPGTCKKQAKHAAAAVWHAPCRSTKIKVICGYKASRRITGRPSIIAPRSCCFEGNSRVLLGVRSCQTTCRPVAFTRRTQEAVEIPLKVIRRLAQTLIRQRWHDAKLYKVESSLRTSARTSAASCPLSLSTKAILRPKPPRLVPITMPVPVSGLSQNLS
jgi:hypothetical protein